METDHLKQRLYSCCAEEASAPCSDSAFTTVEELGKLCTEDGEDPLEKRITHFKREQADKLYQYLNKGKQSRAFPLSALYLLHGWNDHNPNRTWALTEHSRTTSGGFYLRWNGKGIAINPGTNFLDHFHSRGLTVRDIDYVIVSQEASDSYADISEIYALNGQLNKIDNQIHIIHYYLIPSVYQKLHPILKPHSKQERNTVHELDLFADTAEAEKIELTPEIELHYFSLSNESQTASSLPLRFELKREHSLLRFGYVSKTAWTPLLSHHLGFCDVLLLGFGNTSEEDYQEQKHNEDSLGYYGSYSLLEDIRPKLLLSTEYGGKEGDIRLEIAERLRRDFMHHYPSVKAPVVLPGDLGLLIDLHKLAIQGSLTQELLDPSNVTIIRSSEAYGPLYYLSPNNCLGPANNRSHSVHSA